MKEIASVGKESDEIVKGVFGALTAVLTLVHYKVYLNEQNERIECRTPMMYLVFAMGIMFLIYYFSVCVYGLIRLCQIRGVGLQAVANAGDAKQKVLELENQLRGLSDNNGYLIRLDSLLVKLGPSTDKKLVNNSLQVVIVAILLLLVLICSIGLIVNDDRVMCPRA